MCRKPHRERNRLWFSHDLPQQVTKNEHSGSKDTVTPSPKVKQTNIPQEHREQSGRDPPAHNLNQRSGNQLSHSPQDPVMSIILCLQLYNRKWRGARRVQGPRLEPHSLLAGVKQLLQVSRSSSLSLPPLSICQMK